MRKSIDFWLRFGCIVLIGTCAACVARDDIGSAVSTANRETGLPAPLPAEAIPLASDGSTAALTAEVRQLRAAEQLQDRHDRLEAMTTRNIEDAYTKRPIEPTRKVRVQRV